uniref:SAP domain-containing protein n=1 Tax=Peronospora matthiolae TaxID=2874970 RepID=A0AAV1TUI5_9STRA
MADRVESADERALRRELQALAKQREALINSKRQGGKTRGAGRGASPRGSVFARLGGKITRGARQALERTDRSNLRGNAPWTLGKRDRDDDARSLSNAVKKQKLHSAVARPEGVYHSVVRVEETSRDTTSPVVDTARAQEQKQRAVAPYTQKDGIARSRRMFGALMGHLGKAKRQIEKDTDLFRRQDTKQHEAEEKEKAQSKNLEEQARREAEIVRLEALVARTELDRSEQIARAKLEHLRMVRRSESQSKFLVTIASPPINYLPAKHTEETKELVAASMEAHEAKIKASEQSHEENLRKLEAEFATKLKQLREDLKAVKKDGVEETADRHATSEKEEDAMDEGDLDMIKGSGEPEQDVEMASEHGDGSPTVEVENSDTAQHRVSDDEAGDSVEPARAAGEGVRRSPVRSESSQKREGKGQSVSPQAAAVGQVVDHSDTGASSASRVNEEVKVPGLAQESPKQKPNEPVQATVTKKSKEAYPAKGEEAEPANVEEVAAINASDAEPADDEEAAPANDEEAALVNVEEAAPANVEKAMSAGRSGIVGKTADGDESDATINVDKLKVVELRAKLKERGLDTKGFKAKLVQRLKQAMQDEDGSK